MRGAKRERNGQPPHQGRWTRLGTAIGDMIQRDVLFAEKHFEKTTGRAPQFVFEKNALGEPLFEDFAKVNPVIEHNGQRFCLFGTCDGILLYTTAAGEVLRVGLEIKSKQTTSAMTSGYSTRNGPKEDHVKQCVCYSAMYSVDYYVILYVNGSKKAWNMTEEDFAKTPDIVAFGVFITDEMRSEVLDHFAYLVDAVTKGEPPALDLDKWLFNDFKQAIALSLSETEFDTIRRKVALLQRSNLPDHKKRGPAEALAFIEAERTAVFGEVA